MTPNPSNFQAFSSARELSLGVARSTFCATRRRRELLQPQAWGEARGVCAGAFSSFLGA
jgi:hypothetical protein